MTTVFDFMFHTPVRAISDLAMHNTDFAHEQAAPRICGALPSTRPG
jgi:hypothetical protein